MDEYEATLNEANDFENDVFEYLDDLRASGTTNMFGAGSYVRDTFGVTRREARELVSKGVNTFDERNE